MTIQTLPLETNRLYLRPFQLEDAADVFQNWASDPLVQPLYREPVYETLGEVQDMLHRYLTQCDEKSACRWAICAKENGHCMGQISYYLIDAVNNWAELEYCLGRAFQKNGYMAEAVQCIIRYGFDVIGLHRIQIAHMETNDASRRVIEKCGFHYEGTRRDAFQTASGYVNVLYYSILASEWK